MLDNEKLLFDELYEKTKDCGRVQFVELLMTKERENQELKKQLTTYKILHRDCKVDNLKNISKIEEMENQQKEFIGWLEAMSKMYENEYKDIDIAGHYNCVLAKYKEIIGDDKQWEQTTMQ